jgi:hypothetical protein
MPLDPLHSSAIRVLHKALVERASAAPFAFAADDKPEAWIRSFPQEQLEKLLESREDMEGEGLPPIADETRATILVSANYGQRAILVAPVEELSLASDSGRAALTAAAHLRAHLEPADARVDLFLFLVPPPGLRDNQATEETTRRLERNEHICRTFVWIPASDEDAWNSDIEEFTARTFLAQPFGTEADSTQNLDPLHEAIVHAIVQPSSSDPLLLSEQARAWQRILTSEDSGDEIARQLVDTLGVNEP